MGTIIASKVIERSAEERDQLRKRGSLLKWSGFAVWLLGCVGSLVVEFLFPKLVDVWGGFTVMPFAVGAVCWTLLYQRGKRCAALSAEEVLGRDSRPPVIYLRSFKDDRSDTVKTSKDNFPLWRILHPVKLWASALNMFDTRTEEEILSEALQQVGPVVGIGRPGEKLPQLGAARVYVSDDNWKQTVHGFLDHAGLAVLRLGKTPGFFWEVEQSATRMDPTRLILLVPLSRRKYEEFCERAAGCFPKGLPAYNCSRFRRIFGANLLGDLKGLIYFKPDWTPVFVDLARIKWPWKYKVRMAGRRDLLNAYDWAFQPVYQQLGVKWEPPRIGFKRAAVIAYKSLPLVFIAGVAVLAIVMSLR